MCDGYLSDNMPKSIFCFLAILLLVAGYKIDCVYIYIHIIIYILYNVYLHIYLVATWFIDVCDHTSSHMCCAARSACRIITSWRNRSGGWIMGFQGCKTIKHLYMCIIDYSNCIYIYISLYKTRLSYIYISLYKTRLAYIYISLYKMRLAYIIYKFI